MNASTAASPPLPLRHCYWVVPGLLLAGEHPGGPTRDKTKDRLKKLLAAGIECFVDLTKPTELPRYDTLLPFYVEYTRKAIKDHGLPASREQMIEILDAVGNSMRAGRAVYVHCRAGIGRTGTVVGCLLVERGLSGDGALDELNRLWQQSKRSRTWAFIPETEAQATYVRQWQPSATSGGFEMTATATAVSAVGSISAAGDPRPGRQGVADVQARAAIRATGAGQARAAMQSLAATKSRKGSKTSAAGYLDGGGRTAAAAQARAAVEAGQQAPSPTPAIVSAAALEPFAPTGPYAPTSHGTPPRQPAPPAQGTPARQPAPPAQGAPAHQPTSPTHSAPPRQAPPVSQDVPPPEGTMQPQGASPRQGTPPTRGSPLRQGTSLTPAAPPRQAPPASQDVPPSEGTMQPQGASPRQGTSPTQGAPLRQGTSLTPAAPPRQAPPASQDVPPFEGTMPSRGATPAQGATPPYGASPRQAAPATQPTTSLDSRVPEGRGASRLIAEPAHPGVPKESSASRATSAGLPAQTPADPAAPREPPTPRAASEMATARASKEPATTRLAGEPARSRAGTDRLAPHSAPALGGEHVRADAAPTRASGGAAVGQELPAEVEDPLLDPGTLAMARALRERFVGALLGLAVGDALAAATQYRRAGSFTPIGDMIGGGPFDLPRGAWSDDTAMALCLAESLLECNGFDARDQVQRYGRWQQDGYLSSTGQCVGITASTARSLAIAGWRRVVFPGSHDPEQLDPEPLSRIAPIALYYFASLETTLQQSAESSRTTCQAPAVLDACRYLGRALHAALSGQPKTVILPDVIPVAVAHTNSTAAAALTTALWAFGSTTNFRDAVLRAVNVGGNSDVVASVCGQLAGAHYGFSAIPPAWRNGLMHKDLIEGYADRLLAHVLVCLSN